MPFFVDSLEMVMGNGFKPGLSQVYDGLQSPDRHMNP